ncbi:sialidase family protein [Microlunatus parietis]|uniref:exo-alpha-sialidase n=1 Tax=Microlunatus parietis TaxID=682979 RepID=A0A7Y9LFM9_9ACTN|nr:sialidase family protein [Microlunatus parietis]NYE75013.1 sialidase-1 [Microlunatus parietis]
MPQTDHPLPLDRRSFLITGAAAGASALGLGAVQTLPASADESAAPPPYSETTVFTNADRTLPYNVYHQVGIVQAGDGVLLAYAEGRIATSDLTRTVDLVYRRSPDGGRTWDAQISVLTRHGTVRHDGADRPVCYFNANLLYDSATGIIWAFCDRKIGEPDYTEQHQFEANRMVYLTSRDNGRTWSDIREVPADLFEGKPGDRHVSTAGHGLKTSSGRLLMPVSHQYRHYRPDFTASFLYSDDGGDTWRISEPIPPRAPYAGFAELRIAETAPGTILAIGRGRNGDSEPGLTGGHFKVRSVSTDDGLTWSPAELEPDLPEWFNGVDHGMINLDRPRHDLVIVSSSDVPSGFTEHRGNLTAYYSLGQGRAWRRGPRLVSGASNNSDLVQLGSDLAGCLFCKGKYAGRSVYQSPRVVFARFTLDWLFDTDRPAPVARWRLDEGSGDRVASSGSERYDGRVVDASWVRDGGRPVLEFDGRAGFVDFGDVLDPGPGSFTVSLWFRRASAAVPGRQLGLITKGNLVSTRAGFSVVLSTAGLPVVRVNAGGGTAQRASQQATTAVLDDDWHHLALVIDRSRRLVNGFLDGSILRWQSGGSGPATDVIDGFGPIDTAEPLRIGCTSVDGVVGDHFEGRIADVAVFRRALSNLHLEELARAGR